MIQSSCDLSPKGSLTKSESEPATSGMTSSSTISPDPRTTINRGVWSAAEHDRFLEALQIYPNGPWRFVAKHVGTRDSRQVQTHAQKYYEKLERHQRGLLRERRCWTRPEHRIEPLILDLRHSPSHLQLFPARPGTAINDDIDWINATTRETWDDELKISDDARTSRSPTATHRTTSSDACEATMEMELPSIEESLDLLIEYLSDSSCP